MNKIQVLKTQDVVAVFNVDRSWFEELDLRKKKKGTPNEIMVVRYDAMYERWMKVSSAWYYSDVARQLLGSFDRGAMREPHWTTWESFSSFTPLTEQDILKYIEFAAKHFSFTLLSRCEWLKAIHTPYTLELNRELHAANQAVQSLIYKGDQQSHEGIARLLRSRKQNWPLYLLVTNNEIIVTNRKQTMIENDNETRIQPHVRVNHYEWVYSRDRNHSTFKNVTTKHLTADEASLLMTTLPRRIELRKALRDQAREVYKSLLGKLD